MHTYNPSTSRLRHKDHCKLKGSLNYKKRQSKKTLNESHNESSGREIKPAMKKKFLLMENKMLEEGGRQRA